MSNDVTLNINNSGSIVAQYGLTEDEIKCDVSSNHNGNGIEMVVGDKTLEANSQAVEHSKNTSKSFNENGDVNSQLKSIRIILDKAIDDSSQEYTDIVKLVNINHYSKLNRFSSASWKTWGQGAIAAASPWVAYGINNLIVTKLNQCDEAELNECNQSEQTSNISTVTMIVYSTYSAFLLAKTVWSNGFKEAYQDDMKHINAVNDNYRQAIDEANKQYKSIGFTDSIIKNSDELDIEHGRTTNSLFQMAKNAVVGAGTGISGNAALLTQQCSKVAGFVGVGIHAASSAIINTMITSRSAAVTEQHHVAKNKMIDSKDTVERMKREIEYQISSHRVPMPRDGGVVSGAQYQAVKSHATQPTIAINLENAIDFAFSPSPEYQVGSDNHDDISMDGNGSDQSTQL